MSTNTQLTNTVGETLIELLMIIGLTGIILPALFSGFVATRQGKAQQQQRQEATMMLKETAEAVRSVRENGWSTFAVNGTYHPELSGNTWTLVPGTEVVNGIMRQVDISDVYRDVNNMIVPAGGTVDPSTKKIDIAVSWTEPYALSITSTLYVTRFLDNLATTQTTVSDFTGTPPNISALNGITITNSQGGEITLAHGNSNWCDPQNNILATFTLPKQGNAINAAPGAAVDDPGSAYIGMGDGILGPTFVKLNISSPSPPDPPVISQVGTPYTSTYKTNAVFSDGTYYYLATDGGSSQVVILDATYTKVGWIDVVSGTHANGVFIKDNVAYVTSGNQLYTYDLSVPMSTNPKPRLTSGTEGRLWDTGATAKQVVVQGNKAYVTMSGSITGLETFTVSNGGRDLFYYAIGQINWWQDPKGLAVNSSGTRAYIAFSANGAVKGGFYIIDISKRVWFIFWWHPNIATFNTQNMNPQGMSVATANKAIVVGNSGALQYQVVDISNDNPVLCGGLNIPEGIGGVSSIIQPDGRVFSYIISGEAHDQFKVIEGGSGGTYASDGTFESMFIDAGYSTSFNRFTANITQPSQTTLKMQIAVAAPVSNSCQNASYLYVGPAGQTDQYFVPQSSEITGIIPYGAFETDYQNPNRCLKYKLWFHTDDANQTPVFNDVGINYSP